MGNPWRLQDSSKKQYLRLQEKHAQLQHDEKKKKKKAEDIKQMSEEETNATVHFYKTSGKYGER